MNIDPNLIEKSITKRTRAIIPVHFAGRHCDMDAIMSIAKKHHLLLDIDKIGISRDTFQQALHNENIGTGIHFVALHLHPYYANTFGFKRGDFPNAEFVSDRTISLPLSAKLTEEDTDDVIRAVKKIIEKHSI